MIVYRFVIALILGASTTCDERNAAGQTEQEFWDAVDKEDARCTSYCWH